MRREWENKRMKGEKDDEKRSRGWGENKRIGGLIWEFEEEKRNRGWGENKRMRRLGENKSMRIK